MTTRIWIKRLFIAMTALTVTVIFIINSHIKAPCYTTQFVKPIARPWLKHFSTLGDLEKRKDKLVCSIALLNTAKFILITTGFRRNKEDVFSNCTINGNTIPGKRIDFDLFECEETSSLNEDDVLSIQLSDGTIVPSLAVWGDRTPLSIGHHPKIPLCILTQMKNNSGKIADWTEYHIKQGVGLFLVYNNNSTDNTLSELQRYREVVVVDWPWRKSQHEILIHGMVHLKEACEWVIHMDVDEYIFPNADNASYTLSEIMYRFPKWLNSTKEVTYSAAIDQVCFDTKVMGTSGYIHCPNLPVAEAYIDFFRWWYIEFGKCAVRPMRVLPRSGVHRLSVPGNTVRLLRTAAHLVHYKWQCWDYFVTKYDKGRSSGITKNFGTKNLDRNKPRDPWMQGYRHKGPNDTAFRDYKRTVDRWPLHG